MNLVDGDVDMQVVGVVVYGADTLVVAVAKPDADALLDLPQGVGAELLASAETDDQVIGLVALGPRVAVLGCQNLGDGIPYRRGVAIGDLHLAQSVILALRVGDVAHQAGEIGLAQ
ncbi:hypothetical protein G6F35_017343 [Rhizopus arrhizus]|nr:hypothetical protein G6F35_017343 [Rhizopus arrhizus]